MDYARLLKKKHIFNQGKRTIDKNTILSYERDFELMYTHNSTAIEGNTLTLMETKVVLEDGISIGGKELREIYEVVNHKKAYCYVKKCILISYSVIKASGTVEAIFKNIIYNYLIVGANEKVKGYFEKIPL